MGKIKGPATVGGRARLLAERSQTPITVDPYTSEPKGRQMLESGDSMLSNLFVPLDSHRHLFFFRSMARLVRKDEVDPKRFTGKEFTRRPAFPNHPNDYSIIIDGLNAGRIMQMMRPGGRVMWFWSMTAPYYPHSIPLNGEEETFEAANEAFRKLFWEWHAWALKQPGKVTWYGAKE